MVIWIDGDDVEAESPETVRELLRLASDASGRCKHDRTLVGPDGTPYVRKSIAVLLHPGDRFTTRK